MMRRRQFIARMGLLGLALKFGLLAGCRRDAEEPAAGALDHPGALEALRELAGQWPGIGFIGPTCRDRIDRAATAGEFLERLRATGTGSLEQAIASRVAADFRTGRVEDIDGWQLSRTECRLAALAATVQGIEAPELQEFGELTEATIVPVADWGPKETYAGEVFNRQPGDRGALWVRIDSQAPGSVRVMIGEHLMDTRVRSEVITASLDAESTGELIGQPGAHPVYLIDEPRGRIQQVGVFAVHRRPPPARLEDGRTSRVFCEVERWGPKATYRGEAFNPRSDGSSSFWVRIGCAPESTRITLAGRELPTRVRVGLVSARVEDYASLEPGSHALRLVDPESGERVLVGEFVVQ